MKIVIFGLTVSSSWGNGHATLWRGLLRFLGRRGCHVVFYEHNVPYYAMNRDLSSIPGGELILYDDWAEVEPSAIRHIAEADVAVVTSYCPHGIQATDLLAAGAHGLRVFYDLDTPVTLARLSRGEPLTYIGPRGLADFDLVLSYTGGAALEALRSRLGARRVVPLYGHVDIDTHRPVKPEARFASDLSYIGTYSADRQAKLKSLFIDSANHRPGQRFLIAGSLYPTDFPWAPNIFFLRHLAPYQHPAFYSSSRLTLNVTREAMAATGWCPSGRLFEAAACGTAILSDYWPGLEDFFAPGRDILVADDTARAVEALDLSDAELQNLGRNARERVHAEHTSERRVDHLLATLESVRSAGPQSDLTALEA
jgi:spore maturation protein CgeB